MDPPHTHSIPLARSSQSTAAYRSAAADLANRPSYKHTDVVMVSVNGRRDGRVVPVSPTSGELLGAYQLLQLAVDAGATIITDAAAARPGYNIGQ